MTVGAATKVVCPLIDNDAGCNDTGEAVNVVADVACKNPDLLCVNDAVNEVPELNRTFGTVFVNVAVNDEWPAIEALA